MVLLLVSLWLVVEAYEKEPKRECECCGILRATGLLLFGAAAAQIAFYVVSSPFTIAKSIGMSTILGFIAAPLAVGAAVRGFACLGQALKCDC
jgi:hypothetical protein